MKGNTGRKISLIILIIVCAAIIGVFGFKTVSGRKKAEDRVIQVSAKNFEFKPSEIKLKKGETVVLEFKTEDIAHGFGLPDFHISTKIKPGEVSRVRFTPDKVGSFPFICSVFCGKGHEEMTGTVIVSE